MEEVNICIRCQNVIKPKEHFIEITEWDNQKLLKKNRVHYSCWELFMDTKNTQHQALGMLKNVMGKLNYINN